MSEEMFQVEGPTTVFVTKSGKCFIQKKNGEFEERLSRKDDQGRYNVGWTENGKSQTRELARIMAITFMPYVRECPAYYQIMHQDGNKKNCALDNLVALRRSVMADQTELIDKIDALDKKRKEQLKRGRI